MDRIRLNRKDWITLVVCIVIFGIGLWVGINYFDRAFPEASIDFRYTRQDSEELATRFLDQMHLVPPQDYRHAAAFSYDGTAKVYLEKELGLDSAQHYFGEPIRLWYWGNRWFKPSTKEEYRVKVSPDGKVIGFAHLIDEDAQGADLPRDSALTLAQQFLYGTMGLDSSKVEFLEASRKGQPNRADWTFTWKAKGIEPVKGSDYRYSVTILGDQPGGYREYLHVPEAWKASYSRLRSYNNLAGGVDSLFLLLTALAIAIMVFIKIRHRQIRWRISISFGIVAAVLVYLNNLNQMPLALYGYDTTTSWSGFMLREVLVGLLQAIGVGVLIAALTAGAESIYREKYAGQLSLTKTFTLRGLRTKRSFIAIVVGITMTSFFFAYQVAFYLIAQRLGAWSPADVPYTNLLNTAFPWVAVLMIGFMPAVSEEFMSRMFSIPFLQKLFKNRFTWLAILIPAFIWGFGHAAYPNQPFYIRGVEVGIGGIIVGIIMLRFGILATLVWHYTVDALYTAFLLFRSENTYFVITAAVAAGLLAIPLLAALIAYWKSGTFLPETGMLNGDVQAESEEEATVSETPEAEETAAGIQVVPYTPLPFIPRLAAVILLVAGVLITPKVRVGDFLKYPVSMAQATASFEDSLKNSGWADPDTMHVLAFGGYAGSLGPANMGAYLLKHVDSVSEFNDIMENRLHTGNWIVRAWVPENRLRFSGVVNGRTGVLSSLGVMMPEEMPGDSLSGDSALALVNAAFKRAGVDLTGFKLQDEQETARPKRMDHTITYETQEDDPRNIGEARLRYTGNVDGSYVSVSRNPWYKLPESWTRDRNATTTVRMIRKVADIAFTALLIGYALALLLIRTRKGLVPWKRAFLVAIIPGVLSLLAIPGMIRALTEQYFYSVQLAWSVFLGTTGVGLIVVILGKYVMFALVFALLGSLYADKRPLLQGVYRRIGARDAWAAVVGAIGVVALLKSIHGFLAVANPAWIPFESWPLPQWLGYPFAAGTLFSTALSDTARTAFLAGLVAYMWDGPFRKVGLRILLVIALIFIGQSGTGVDANEWLFQFITTAIGLIGLWFVLRFIVGGRPVSFFAAAWAVSVVGPAYEAIFGYGNHRLMIQGWLFFIVSLIALILWLHAARIPKRAS